MGALQFKSRARHVEWLAREWAALDPRSEMEAEALELPLAAVAVLVVRQQRQLRRANILVRLLLAPVVAARRRRLRRCQAVLRVLLGEYLRLLTFEPVQAQLYVARNTTIDGIDAGSFAINFRFRSADVLHRLKDRLHVPLVFRTPSRHVFTGEELLLMLLYRLKSPEHLAKVGQFFGAASRYKAISKGLHAFRPWFLRSWAYLVLDNLDELVPKLQGFSEVIRTKMEENSATVGPNNPNPAALTWPPMDPQTGQGFNVALFVDGALHAGARPGGGPVREGTQAPRVDDRVQQAFYAGRKKLHGLNMQIVGGPDGIVASAFQPVSARRHDALVYALSHFNPNLRDAQLGNVMQFKVFGDSAYPSLSHTTKNLPNVPGGTHYAYNSVRECIEWDWRDIKHYWARSSARAWLQIRKKPTSVCDDMMCTVIFANLYTTVYGNQTSRYFNLLPPTLEEYTSQGPR